MNSLGTTVIIATRNRPQKLAATVASLRDQSVAADSLEIVVADDGSTPPVVLPPPCRVIRLEGVERSAARNAIVGIARGEILIFVDDDMTFGRDFIAHHVAAQNEWPGAL